jgi:crotonobetainyl-CoA:carnitine CoA-transferase CaiB-like acyl-CoA transferase
MVTNINTTLKPGMLAGLRVIEIADEMTEYCGLLLAGLGAEVIKIEPPSGSLTRNIGPFLDDINDPERSLHFWTYNRGKLSVVIDLKTESGIKEISKLLHSADILLDGSYGLLNKSINLDRTELANKFPNLIIARMTPFGDTGPWKDYIGSDLIHLALGGVMMCCGYDPDPKFKYDLPPIAPQLWHAYHIAGEQLAVGIVAALLHRENVGEGQEVSCSVHECVSKNTEVDVMTWIMRRVPLWRLTCRHAQETPNHMPIISHTKDGRWFITYGSGTAARGRTTLAPFLENYGMAIESPEPEVKTPETQGRAVPGTSTSSDDSLLTTAMVQRLIRAHTYENTPWREAQEQGLLWAPLRKPHENALDEHWLKRGTFAQVEHPELGKSFLYPTSKWLSTSTSWRIGRRAPLLGEDTATILNKNNREPFKIKNSAKAELTLSARGKPFPLQGIRILDFSWFLASAGGTRYLAALGAESLKVEWKANPDTRLAAMSPLGGRAARDVATGPLKGVTDPDMGGQFNNKNSGKRGLSLNIRDPRGLEIARELVKISDIVAEGFSPGVMTRLGLGYEDLIKIKPNIIYIQQAGMGEYGTYGRLRTVGPVAAAFAGTSEMSGLPEPAMPAGWGYSYLDWIGAYSFALAILGALYHRERTGEGQWIDASQCEAGIYLTGVPVLDWSANNRPWKRFGNRSPYKPAAPHGAYRCQGEDNWIAIACFDDQQWTALCEESGIINDPMFASLAKRMNAQDTLDSKVNAWTQTQDAKDLMVRLQKRGIPAGVCQTAADRYDSDPQLIALDWLTEVNGTKIGRWPVYDLPMKLSKTPAYAGGPIDRGAPCYGEDNEYILNTLLGISKSDIKKLIDDNII